MLRWNKPGILIVLAVGAWFLIEDEGVVNAAAYIFIGFALYIVYKTWSRNI